MESVTDRPRLAVIVANGITGDSRVQKIAVAAARDGWDVTLLGRGTGPAVERSTMGPIEVVRVPVPQNVRRYVTLRQGWRVRRAITQFGIPDAGALARYRAAYNAWRRYQTARRRPPPRIWMRLRRVVHMLRVRAWGWEQFRRPKSVPPTGDWRRDWPQVSDMDLAYGPVLEKLKPHVIHANDINTIGTAAIAATRLRRQGHPCAWLYDAHEYVAGVEWPTAQQAVGCRAVEREFITRADAVVTVSPQIAELLRRDHGLPRPPLVVGNCPVREGARTEGLGASARAQCGLPADTPLLVYGGWIGKERGLDTVVAGLPRLPGVHLALVCGGMTPLLEELLAQANALGVRDRIHVLPYVAPYEVAEYLSSADIGLIPFRRTPNCELSLPTKVSEYLHAGLPVVTSDVRTVSEFVERHGLGEVFASDDADSFAAAVTRAVQRRAELAARITEPILKELSWEHQSAGLLQLYREVSGLTPPNSGMEVPWDVQEQPGPPPLGSRDEVPKASGWRRLGDTPVRLGLGPANYAGQAAAFARAICHQYPRVSAEVVMWKQSASFDYPADVYLEARRLRTLDVQTAQMHRIVGRYTHLLVDAFLPVFGRFNGDNISDDLPALKRARVKVGLLAHGSEIRDPDRHLEQHPYSLFRDAPEDVLPELRSKAERNRRVAVESGLPLWVTTPDLLDDVPGASWAPLIVDTEVWASDHPVMERRRPVVLHAPSKRWTKGTDHILPVVEDLAARGLITLRLAEGIPWAEMRELVRGCDLVLDQFTTGSFGTFAVEAMAAGRPVVARLSDTVIKTVGDDLPIINATPETLAETIESLLDDRDRAVRVGAASVEYVRRYHDGTWTARVLAPFLT